MHILSFVNIVYLNKLPTKENPHQGGGGTHSSPHAHERRGHRYTLRSERYKNHPMYGVEKGMYKKPSWIGSKESIVRGVTYKVLTKETGESHAR